MATPSEARVDKWLWAARIYKTRTIAADACKNNRVTINDRPAKPQGLRLHFLRQRKAVDAVLEAGIIVDFVAQGHLPAGRQLLQHHRGQPSPGGVQGGGEPGRPAAENHHVIKAGCFCMLHFSADSSRNWSIMALDSGATMEATAAHPRRCPRRCTGCVSWAHQWPNTAW